LNAGEGGFSAPVGKRACTSAGNDDGKANVCYGQMLTFIGIELRVLAFADYESMIIIRHLLNQCSSLCYHLQGRCH